MTTTDHLEAWMQDLRAKNFSPATLRLYADQIKTFTDFLERRTISDLRWVNQALLQNY